MDVRVLGQIEASAAGKPYALGGPTQRRVFVALVVRRGEIVDVSVLVDVCWPDGDAPERAEHNVRTYMHRLRTALGDDGDRVETIGTGYRLRLEPGELDLDRFEACAGVARRAVGTGDCVAALDAVEQATAMWRGRPFAEFADESWAMADVARIDELRAGLREHHGEALLVAGRASDAVGALEQLVRDEPLRERPRALLMRALYESGRQAEALRAYQDFRRYLIDEAGVEPSRDLVELDRKIANGTLGSSTTTRTVGSYELHERIGEGAFAVVHRATQASLARDVAIKVIRAELANQPQFIRRFEAEAQMVAAIEHPHVVPLYDYWREPGQAFLVMRWMTGGSLETRLDEGPLDLDATVTLVDQIADALDAAHAHDIVHRDVKPANILFDESGRALLGDFGIALAAEERSTPDAALSEGSPIFASPEQLRREAAGPEADVHALGIVAFNALSGRTPFHDARDESELLRRQLDAPVPAISSVRVGMPSALDEVIARATAKRPGDRYPTAGAFAAAFRRASGGEAPADRATQVDRTNPYLGLRAFTEADAGLFHGRERLVAELLGACRDPDQRLVSVVGPSGSGKSSVVRAGLVPALRSGGVAGSAEWFVTTMVPGTHPFEALETALLRVAANPPAALLDQLRDGDRGIHRGVRRVVPGDRDTVLVVIDQFEELFTATAPDERQRFLRALAVAVTEPEGPLRVVVTMRADFYDQPLRHAEFASLFKRSTVAVTPLAPDELEAAIAAPAAAVGMRFEPGLVAEIVADVNSQPGALPLLQYALTQTYEATDGDVLATDRYREIGGLTGALGTRAEALHDESSADERRALRHLLGRLVTLGEGTDDTRRRIRRSELPGDADTDRVIDRFGAARLLTFDRDPVTREPTIEIAHEALLREWPRLRGWLDDDREHLRVHRHLTAAATAWDGLDRDPNELYRGGRLDAAEQLLEAPGVALNPTERAFVLAAVDERERLASAERKRVRRLRRLVSATAVVALLALVAGAIALWQWRRADDAATAADLERIQAIAANVDENDPTVALLLALEAHRAAPSPRTLGLVHHALTGRAGLVTTFGDELVTSVTLVEEGRRVVTNTDDAIEVWDVATRTRTARWPVEIGTVSPLLVSSAATPDGRYAVLNAGVNGTKVVDLADGDTIRLQDGAGPLDPFSSPITLAVYDASAIAVGDFDGDVTVYDVAGNVVQRVDRTSSGPPRAMAWTADGELLAIGEDPFPGQGVGVVEVWSVERSEIVSVNEPSEPAADAFVSALLFSADGKRLAVARNLPDEQVDGDVFSGVDVVDVATGATIVEQIPDGHVRRTLAWTDDAESRLLAISLAGEMTEFDLATRSVDSSLADATGMGGALALDRQAGLAYVAARLGVEVRSLGASVPLLMTAGLTDEQQALVDGDLVVGDGHAFDDDSDDVVHSLVAQVDGEYRAVTARSDPRRGSVAAAPYLLANGAEPFADGAAGYTFTFDERGITVRPGLDGDEIGPPVPYPGADPRASLSPAGDRLVTWDDGEMFPTFTLWDTVTGKTVAVLTPPESAAFATPTAVFSFDGSGLAIWNGLRHRTYDPLTGRTTFTDVEHGYAVPFGQARIVAERYGDIRIVDANDSSVGPDLIGHTRQAIFLYVSPDGSKLASAARDGTVRVWDLSTGEQLGRPIPIDADDIRAARWAPDSTTLAYPTEDGLQLWNYDTATWPRIGCEVAGRNLTRAEWEQFGPRGVEYRATCEEYPIAP